MALTVEQMTIAELQAVIRERKKLVKKIPALRKERSALMQRLAEIDAKLAQYGAGFRRRRGGRKAAVVKAAGPDRPPTTELAARPGKRLPRGSVQRAILDVLEGKTMAPADISREIAATRIKGISPKSVAVAIDKMKRTGKIIKVDRGLYRKV